MINRSALKTKLEESGYPVVFQTGKQPDISDIGFQIGYLLTHNSSIKEYVNVGAMGAFAESHIQGFEILLICKPEDYVTMWTAMFLTLNRWVPYPNEFNSSGFVHVNGQVMGINNDIQWSREIWYNPFPIMTELTL